MCPLYDPAVAAQALRGLNPPACNPRREASLPQSLALVRCIVGLIGLQLGRPLTRPPVGTFDRRHSVRGDCPQLAVRDIGPRAGNGQRKPLPVDPNRALRARFAALRWIRAGRWAPRGAGTGAEAIAARVQSLWSASPQAFKKVWCTCGQIPGACQWRSRRQQVMPLPQPSSWGQSSQGMAVRSTKRMPVRVARLGRRRRPPLGRGGGEGKEGARTPHSSSGRIAFALAVLPPQPGLPDQRRFC